MEITTTMIIGSLVNLALFIGLAVYFGKAPIAKGLQARSEKVAALLKDAEGQIAEMSAKLAEQKKQLGDIQATVAEIKTNGDALAKNLGDELVANARTEGEQLRTRATREIDAEVQLTRQKLRQELGRQALAQAERLLSERLDAGSQTQLIRDFASTMPAARGENGHGGN